MDFLKKSNDLASARTEVTRLTELLVCIIIIGIAAAIHKPL